MVREQTLQKSCIVTGQLTCILKPFCVVAGSSAGFRCILSVLLE